MNEEVRSSITEHNFQEIYLKQNAVFELINNVIPGFTVDSNNTLDWVLLLGFET